MGEQRKEERIEDEGSLALAGCTPLERIRELSIYDGEEDLDALESFTYKWTGHGDGSGYEELDAKSRDGGGLHYAGVYHPGEGLCEGNPCQYCGHVWHD